jgi:hypothetical protein
MPDRSPFNPADPFDAIADLAKSELAYAGIRLTERPEYKAIEADADVGLPMAVMCGALTAVCGIVMSHAAETDENHAIIRAAMTAYLPQAIDQARSILGLPPLPADTSDPFNQETRP